MFSKSFELTLNSAYDRAREKKHEFITVEHLLLALVDNPEASEILLSCGANLDRLRAGLGIFVDETTPSVVNPAERDIQPTISFQRVLQRSIYQVQSAGQTEVTGAYALASIFGEPDSQAVYFLHQENVTRIDVMKFTTQGITKSPREEFNFESNHPLSQTDSPASMRESGSEENILEMYAINLDRKSVV